MLEQGDSDGVIENHARPLVAHDGPKDVQNAMGVYKGHGLLPLRCYQERIDALAETQISAGDADAFYKLLGKSEGPLLYCGGGIINGEAAPELRAFAERFGIPVVTTLMGIGAVDTTSELSLQMLGMHGMAYANYAVEDCDFADNLAGPDQVENGAAAIGRGNADLHRAGNDRDQAAAGIAKLLLAHAAKFVGCRPATLLASEISSRDSAPR